MYIVISCSFIALILTLLESGRYMKNGMCLGFIIITILGAIHYDYGNDYMSYMDMYDTIVSYNFNFLDIINGVHNVDSGWVLLCWLFKPLGGFFAMVATLNIIQNYIVYNFIRKNVEIKWWPIAIAIYLFSTSYYLLSFSMMRQELVIIIFLGLWRFIRDKRWIISITVLLVSSTIHASALVLIPFAFWGYIPVRKSKYISLIYVILFIVLWFSKDFLAQFLNTLLAFHDSFLNYAEIYGDRDNDLHIGVGFFLNLIPFFLSILYILQNNNLHNEHNNHLVALFAISVLIQPFSQVIHLIIRVQMYWGIFGIAAIPIIYQNIKYKQLRTILLCIFLLLLMNSYFTFFEDIIWSEKYNTFHTIFAHM